MLMYSTVAGLGLTPAGSAVLPGLIRITAGAFRTGVGMLMELEGLR